MPDVTLQGELHRICSGKEPVRGRIWPTWMRKADDRPGNKTG